MKKEIQHNEIETCNLSKKEIDTLRENYSMIVDCEGKKIRSVKFYKSELLKNLIKEKGEKVINELQQRTNNLVGNMLQKVGLVKPVYEVKG